MGLVDHNLQQHFAAIVAGSDDAIIAKDLNSIILSWNPAAERIFGYTAEEAVGQPITMLIPQDRQHEEVDFISRLRRGERISHYETVRQKKNGELIPISVTISPIHDLNGQVVGASKIARDISAQNRATEQQRLLLSEMKHRVRNSFAIASGLLRLSANHVSDVEELVSLMRGRFLALAAAHSLGAHATADEVAVYESRSLQDLLTAILLPFTGEIDDAPNVAIDLQDIPLCRDAVTPLALVFYELCTNAVKYGAFSRDDGGLSISSQRRGNRLIIAWEERFQNTPTEGEIEQSGFGTTLCDMALRDEIDGSFQRSFSAAGMHATLDLSYDRLIGKPEGSVA